MKNVKWINNPRELVGGLIYLANAMRPDIAFAVSTLSCFCANPGMSTGIAKRVLKYKSYFSLWNNVCEK